MSGTTPPALVDLDGALADDEQVITNASTQAPRRPPQIAPNWLRPRRQRDSLPAPTGPPGGRKFLSYGNLLALGIRFSRVHLRRLELAGLFPMHVKLGGNSMQTSTAWIEDEVIAWQESRIAARDRKLKLMAAKTRAQALPPRPRKHPTSPDVAAQPETVRDANAA
jgi:predicted DNA-binding transcriptional regulator AlpA